MKRFLILFTVALVGTIFLARPAQPCVAIFVNSYLDLEKNIRNILSRNPVEAAFDLLKTEYIRRQMINQKPAYAPARVIEIKKAWVSHKSHKRCILK